MSDCSTNTFKIPENPASSSAFEDAIINHLYYMQSEMESMADRMDKLEQCMAELEKKRRKQSKYFSNRIFECLKAVNECQRNQN